MIHSERSCSAIRIRNIIDGSPCIGRLEQGHYVEDGSNTVRDEEWDFLHRAMLALQQQDPYLWQYIQQVVIDPRSKQAARQWLDHRLRPQRVDLEGLLKTLFSASPLSRVMMRHTRALLEIYRDEGELTSKLAKRTILPMPNITFSDQERRAYDQLETYCSELTTQLANRGGQSYRTSLGFLLSFLRLRFASSLYAIRETLRRRLEKVEYTRAYLLEHPERIETDELNEDVLFGEDDGDEVAVESLLKNRTPEDLSWEIGQLEPMIEGLADLSAMPSKMRVLLDVLGKRRSGTGRIKQTVVFTRFYDTLTDIVGWLMSRDRGMLVGTYSGRGGEYFDPKSGRMVSVKRESVRQRFRRGEIDVLICTDAAAEGLNLQTADLLINFDLPWNPMKVEQRIGRIDRIGQAHTDIFVLNLCYVDSVEERVYGRLLTRLANAGAIVGTQQMSLLPVTEEDFQLLAEKKLTPDELETRALERAALAKRRTASMEIAPRDLYGIYQRLRKATQNEPLPVTLDEIWTTLSHSQYLRDLGCRALGDEEKQVLCLSDIGGFPDGTALTTARSVLDEGIKDLDVQPHFATYGDPVFHSVLDTVLDFGLPDCVHRITQDLSGVASVVGYAVACIENGVHCVKLVKSLTDLDGLVIDEDCALDDAMTAPLVEELESIARAEFKFALNVERIEEANLNAARSQESLNLLVMQSYLAMRDRMGHSQNNFWQEINEIGRIFEDESAPVLVHKLPADRLRAISGLLFDPVIPKVGNDAHMIVPVLLRRSSLDAVCRLAEGMRVRRIDLSLANVLQRLSRAIV